MSRAGGPHLSLSGSAGLSGASPLLGLRGWVGMGLLELGRGISHRLPGVAVRVSASCGGFTLAWLTPSSLHRSSAVNESCQSLLSHSDISYDRTEDDVVRSDPVSVPGFSPVARG